MPSTGRGGLWPVNGGNGFAYEPHALAGHQAADFIFHIDGRLARKQNDASLTAVTTHIEVGGVSDNPAFGRLYDEGTLLIRNHREIDTAIAQCDDPYIAVEQHVDA